MRISSVLSRIFSSLPDIIKMPGIAAVTTRLEDDVYYRIVRRGFSPSVIIDVGAYKGEWTKNARRYFPSAKIMMIEAQEEKRPHLNNISERVGNASVDVALLSSEAGKEISFYVMETGSSAYAENSDVPRKEIKLISRTLDEVVRQRPDGPLFLKIDAQGSELDILRGGLETIASAELIQLEVPFLDYNIGSPNSYDVLRFMENMGFMMFEIAGFVRPTEDDLVQVDIVFAKKDSRLRQTRFQFT